jgi:hypothetical protein
VLAERDEQIAALERELGAQTYRGNSVAYWHDKAKAYGDMVHGINPALGAREDERPVDAAKRVMAQVESLRLQLSSRDRRDEDRVKKLGKARDDRERLLEALLAVSLGDAKAEDVERFLGDWRRLQVPMTASHGGCWFCDSSGVDAFCKGWDAGYHKRCLDHEKKVNPDNPELTEFP